MLKSLITKITPFEIVNCNEFEVAILLVLSFSPKGSEVLFNTYFNPFEVIFVFLSNPYSEIVSPGNVFILNFPLYAFKKEFSAIKEILI